MRAVIGSVTSSKPISLSRAASVLSRFAAGDADAGVGREVGAYLRRASAAFTDLVEFHRQLRDGLRSVDEAGDEQEPKIPILTRAVEANGVVDASPSEKRSKKKKKEREREGVENGVEVLEDEKKKKKKRKHSSTEEGGAEIAGEEKKKRRRKNATAED